MITWLGWCGSAARVLVLLSSSSSNVSLTELTCLPLVISVLWPKISQQHSWSGEVRALYSRLGVALPFDMFEYCCFRLIAVACRFLIAALYVRTAVSPALFCDRLYFKTYRNNKRANCLSKRNTSTLPQTTSHCFLLQPRHVSVRWAADAARLVHSEMQTCCVGLSQWPLDVQQLQSFIMQMSVHVAVFRMAQRQCVEGQVYSVPLIQPDLRREEAVLQITDALLYLEGISSDIFTRQVLKQTQKV